MLICALHWRKTIDQSASVLQNGEAWEAKPQHWSISVFPQELQRDSYDQWRLIPWKGKGQHCYCLSYSITPTSAFWKSIFDCQTATHFTVSFLWHKFLEAARFRNTQWTPSFLKWVTTLPRCGWPKNWSETAILYLFVNTPSCWSFLLIWWACATLDVSFNLPNLLCEPFTCLGHCPMCTCLLVHCNK